MAKENRIESSTNLAVITYEYDLLGTHCDRDQCLRLDSLSCFIDQNLTKAKVLQPRIARTDTGTTDDICSLQDFAFCLVSQRSVLFLITFTELTNLVLKALQFIEFITGSQGRHDMEAQVIDRGGCCFTCLGCQTHDTQSRCSNFLRQLVDSNITWCCDKNLTHILASQVIHKCGTCDGFTLIRQFITIVSAQSIVEGIGDKPPF